MGFWSSIFGGRRPIPLNREPIIEAALHLLGTRALHEGAADSGLSITFYECSDGRTHLPWGDWELTIRRIRKPESPPQGDKE